MSGGTGQRPVTFNSIVAGEFPHTETIIIEGPPRALRFAFVAVVVSYVVTAVIASDLRARRIAKAAEMVARHRRRLQAKVGSKVLGPRCGSGNYVSLSRPGPKHHQWIKRLELLL